MISFLFVEILLECCEFVLLQDAALEPRLDEAKTVAHELHKGGGDAEQAHPKAAVTDGGVDTDYRAVEKQGQRSQNTEHKTYALVHVVGGAQTVGVEPFALDIQACAKGKEQQAGDDAQRKGRGQQVDEFQCARVTLLEVDAGYAAVVYLTEEFTEVGAALVPYPCLGDEGCLVASLNDAVGEVDILAKAHLRETAQLQVDIATNTHIERAWEELIELLLATTNTSRSKERRHGVANGLLHRRE